MTWGCYLYFSPESEGTLFSKWNETVIENALAGYTPAADAKIPGYLTKNGGKRTEIVRNISASRQQDYFRGYCEFIKSALKYNSTVANYATDGGSKITTILAFLSPKGSVYFPANEEEVKVNDFMAVAVMNADNNILDGMKVTTQGKFVDSVTQGGAYALRFDR